MFAFIMSRRQELPLLPQIPAGNAFLCKPRLVTMMRIINPESKDSTLGAAFLAPGQPLAPVLLCAIIPGQRGMNILWGVK